MECGSTGTALLEMHSVFAKPRFFFFSATERAVETNEELRMIEEERQSEKRGLASRVGLPETL